MKNHWSPIVHFLRRTPEPGDASGLGCSPQGKRKGPCLGFFGMMNWCISSRTHSMVTFFFRLHDDVIIRLHGDVIVRLHADVIESIKKEQDAFDSHFIMSARRSSRGRRPRQAPLDEQRNELDFANQRSVVQFRRMRRGLVNQFALSDQERFTLYTARIQRWSLAQVQRGFEAAVRRLTRWVVLWYRLQDDDHISLVMEVNNKPIVVSSRHVPLQNLDIPAVIALMESAIESGEIADIRDLIITVKFTKAIRGGGGITRHGYVQRDNITVDEFVGRKKSFVKIPRTESNSCFYQCLLLGLSQLEDAVQYRRLVSGCKSSRDRREEFACQLRRDLEITAEGEPFNLGDVERIERKLGVCILIIDFATMRISKTDAGPHQDRAIFMLYAREGETGHFHYINRNHVGAVFGYRRYCMNCLKGYQSDGHRCIQKCYACKSTTCDGKKGKPRDFEIHCNLCGMCFYDMACFERHKQTLCERIHKCAVCKMIYQTKKRHRCGEFKCGNCKTFYAIGKPHECYHLPLMEREAKGFETEKYGETRYIFYDYETYADADQRHIPFLIIAAYGHADGMFHFKTTAKFMDWVLNGTHAGFTVIAHNGGRYDFQFVKEELLRRSVKTKDIVKGNTFLHSVAKKFEIRFIDSLRFLPFPLRKFAKTFGIRDVAKGFFPYRFATATTLNYEGPIPDIEMFDFDHLHDSERQDALAWYAQVKDMPYKLMTECVKYCESDVLLLKRGCMMFREIIGDMTEKRIDPFQYITTPAACMALFKLKYLQPNTIGVLNIPDFDAMVDEEKWYTLMEMTHEKLTKQTHGVLPYRAAFEKAFIYLRCVDHGCSRCYTITSVHPCNGKDMFTLRRELAENLERLKELYPYVKTIYECQWRAHCSYRKMSMPEPERLPLNPQDAFFGGHVEEISAYKKFSENEKGRYVDFTSLYPSVNTCKWRSPIGNREDIKVVYPIGHPTVIRENFDPIEQYFGFIKCKVRPPANLFHPILPERRDGKLMFDLKEKTGTWTTAEVKYAMYYGYEVLKIYEVWHFARYSHDLFDGYIGELLRMKQEAAGWNAVNCITEEEKSLFINEYAKTTGIYLRRERMTSEKNNGLYAISKLMLNSLWGKYGQRSQFSETVDVYTHEDLVKVAHNDRHDVQGIFMHALTSPMEETTCVRTVVYKTRKPYALIPKSTNLAIAAFTTAYARLRLWEVLNVLGKDVLYMDTDSVIYIERPETQGRIQLGPYLGDLTDELDPGDHIVEFVSVGPKSYAYRTAKGAVSVKVKGFTLNYATSTQINFDAMVQLVRREIDTIETQGMTFALNFQRQVHTMSTTKVFSMTSGKRRRIDVDTSYSTSAPWEDKDHN